ncbi:MAG TPA: Dabb family protein [Puia sp.]|nr:Dabb family protein [Puia sp.]
MKQIRKIMVFILFFVSPALTKAQTDTGKSPQYKHVEIVTFKPGTSDSSKHMVDKTYRQAADAFPMVKAFEWGWDENDKSQNKRIYTTTFNSKGDLTTYMTSPAHQTITKTKPASVVSITTVDYPVNK